MTKITFAIILSVAIAGAAQNTIAYRLAIAGIYPDFLLVTVVVLGLVTGESYGAISGGLAGFVHASLAGSSFGTFILSRAILGFVAGLVKGALFQDNPAVIFIAAFIATITGETVFILFNPPVGLFAWASALPFTAMYNGIIAMPIYWLLRRLIHPKNKPRYIYHF